MRRWLRYQYLRLKRTIWRLVRSNSSEHSIALGFGIGFIIGMLPIMGCQMAVAVAVATLFRASRIASVLPVWITNPATFVPIYGFNYWVGNKISGMGPSVKEYLGVLEKARAIGEQIGESNTGIIGYFTGMWHTLVASVELLWEQGWEAFFAFNLGCFLVGLICGVIAYPFAYYSMKKLRYRRVQKRLRRAQRILEQTRREIG